jgi:P27 family predicted phage terminase small subunit
MRKETKIKQLRGEVPSRKAKTDSLPAYLKRPKYPASFLPKHRKKCKEIINYLNQQGAVASVDLDLIFQYCESYFSIEVLQQLMQETLINKDVDEAGKISAMLSRERTANSKLASMLGIGAKSRQNISAFDKDVKEDKDDPLAKLAGKL